MDPEIIRVVNKEIYRRFPEMYGKTPQVRAQKIPQNPEINKSQTYLLVYSSYVQTVDKNTLHRYVRVTINDKGKILKISTSRN